MAELYENGMVKYLCDKCGWGEMQFVCMNNDFDPPRYFSICRNRKCKFQHDLLRKYPQSLYEIFKNAPEAP